MDSSYLKNVVGPVLAKAVAETVVAQPSNPQEYLALYLLHHLQEEQRNVSEASFKRKADSLREEWGRQRALQEKAAVDTIQRGFTRFCSALKVKREREAALSAAYDEAEEEAEDLLGQIAAAREEQEGEKSGGRGGGGGEEETEEGRDASDAITEQEEVYEEARSAFYRAQRFMLSMQKSHLGELKTSLVDGKERARIGIDAVQAIRDCVAVEEDRLLDVEYDPQHRQPQLSAAAAELASRVQVERDHSRVSVPFMTFRVLRSLCYLLYNSTPAATDTPSKVAALIKPTIAVQLLRAFNPVATYDRAVPLKLEKSLPSEGNGEDEAAEGGVDGAEGVESVPVTQSKTRQIRRVLRLLRVAALDSEYVCELNPTNFLDEEYITESATLTAEVAAAETAQARAKEIRESVEEQVKTRGGVVLWSLLRFCLTAVTYRTERDKWVAMRRDAGLATPEGHELPEEEEEDELNEEVLVDEDGDVDHAAVSQLLARIGVDVDESLAKLWEAKDARRRKVLQESAEAFKKSAEGDTEDEGDEEES